MTRIQRESAENLKAEVDLQTVELREQTTAAMQAKVEANALREEAEVAEWNKRPRSSSVELRTPLTLILNPLENQSREQPVTPSSVSASSFATGQSAPGFPETRSR